MICLGMDDLLVCFWGSCWASPVPLRVPDSAGDVLGAPLEAGFGFLTITTQTKLRMCKSNDYRIQHVPSFSRLGHRLLGRRCKPNDYF